MTQKPDLGRSPLLAQATPVHHFRADIPNHDPPESLEGLSWYVVLTNIKAEKRAQTGLRRKGYATYLPLTKRWSTHARKRFESVSALLPRYLFIGLREGQDFYAMRSVDGVEGIVRIGFEPVRIPTKPIARLLEREQAGEFDFTREPEPSPEFAPGEKVRLSKGALSGFVAQVTSLLSSGRVEVLVEFMGGVTRARLSAVELQRLEAAE